MRQEESRPVAKMQIPWPGPMPYEESQWRHFIGRESDIKKLLGRVQVARITILFGESGSGKTSLIRAGVVPKLREGRYTGAGETKGAWPALLLREGGARREETVEMNWLRQLETAIEAMERWGRLYEHKGAIEDAEFLRSALVECKHEDSSTTSFVELIEELSIRQANRAGTVEGSDETTGSGLILVFDQFEEQLRSGPIAQRDAFRLIRDIVVGASPVNILLSMRKEFRGELKDLEKQIGELGRNSVYLERLERSKVLQVIEKVSAGSDISIERQVAERIVAWLTNDEPRLRAEVGGVPGDKGAIEKLSAATPDLLKLQAVLVELCRWVVERDGSSVNEDVFRRFVSELGKNSGKTFAGGGGAKESEAELGERIMGSALERWIEKAIDQEVPSSERKNSDGESFSGVKVPYAELSGLTKEMLRLQVRRITVRMAPLLSSADYKVQQEENVLFRQALGEDIGKLPFNDPTRINDIEIVENYEEGRLHLNWDFVGGLNEPGSVKKWELFAGPARGWTAEETGDRLVACFKDTLERLSGANILRRTPVSNAGVRKNYWELVHDQFGPNLVKWAKNQKGTWEDCHSSLVVCRGIQPLSVTRREVAPEGGGYYDLNSVSWQGCGVMQVMQTQSEQLTFRRVRFRDCYLVGTIFDDIKFVDCRFEHCQLKGGLFRDCSFERTVFDHCDANIAIVRGKISCLTFSDCHLLQPAIDGAKLLGEIQFVGGTRVIQGFFDVVRAGEEGKMLISFDQESRAAFCLAGHESFRLLKFDNLELNIVNSPLREDNRVRLLGQ